MISPRRIKYRGIESTELNILDLIMCVAFDSDNGETSTFLNREAVVSETYDGRYKRVHTYKYSESFSPKFTFMKKGFGNFTMEEVRQVLKWLTGTDTTALLDVYYDDSNVVAWSAIGGWTEISTYKLANNRTVGIVATFEAITPYAMSDLYTVTKTISNATDNKITININTDDNKPVYPRITIKHNGSVVRIPEGTTYTSLVDMIDKVDNTVYFNGTTYYWKSTDGTTPISFHSSTTNPNLATTSVKFTNKHTDFFGKSKVLTSTIVKNNNSTEMVILDGANKIISSSSVNRVFDTDFNLTWLPLLDGKNEITVEGNCTVTLEWRDVRKIGEY